MVIAIVVTIVLTTDIVITRIMIGIRIANLVAITVITHIGIYISMIVAGRNGSWMMVVRWEMIPIIGGMPRIISTVIHISIHGRNVYENGFDNIIASVNEYITYHLYIGCARTAFHYNFCYILEHVPT